MAIITPHTLFKDKILTNKVLNAILPQFKPGKDLEYDFYLSVKLALIEDLRRLMGQSIKFYKPYEAILSDPDTFFELYDMSITDMEILLYGLNKELRESRCYDGC